MTATRILFHDGSHIRILSLETEAIVDLGGAEVAAWDAQGWVAGDDRAYVLIRRNTGRFLKLHRVGMPAQVVAGPYDVAGPAPYRDPWTFVAAPTHDYAGAWMVQRDFGKPTGLWTLALAAEVAHAEGLTDRPVSIETIRQALKRLGVGWRRAKAWITSPDPAYARKKGRATA